MIIAKSYSDDFIFAYNEIGLECSMFNNEISNIEYEHEMMAIEAYRDCNGDNAVLESRLEAIREGFKGNITERLKEFVKGLIEKLKNLWERFKMFISKLVTSNKSLLKACENIDDNTEIEGEFYELNSETPQKFLHARAIKLAVDNNKYDIGTNMDPEKFVEDVIKRDIIKAPVSEMREDIKKYYCGNKEQRKVKVGDAKEYIKTYDSTVKAFQKMQEREKTVLMTWMFGVPMPMTDEERSRASKALTLITTIYNESLNCSVRVLESARSVLNKASKKK